MRIRSISIISNAIQNYELILSVSVILLAFAIRLHNLGGDSFWIDEINTTYDAGRGWRSFFGNRTHPGLFFLITAAATSLFGSDEFAFRLPSLFFATLSISLIIFTGKMLGRTSIGLWAALLLTLSPLHLRHSQEARMYPQLMALSLLSFILLYQALKRPRWSLWVAYAGATVLNLYTHYGALIVLASQSVLIAIWSIRNLLTGKKEQLVFPIASAVLVAILYAPWLPRFLESLQYNVGIDTVTDTGSKAPLIGWLRRAYHDFAMYDSDLAILFLGLCLLGLVFWVIDRRWLDLTWILSGLLLPLVLISVFQVARPPISRYIIYALPFYLLTIGYALDSTLNQVNRRMGNAYYVAGIIGISLFFIWVAWPKVQKQYDFVAEDWRGIINYLDQNAAEGDIVLSMTMNLNFNLVARSMPKYLKQADNSYQLLKGKDIDRKDAVTLKENDGNVWAVLSHWRRPTEFEDPSLQVAHFQTNLHVVHDLEGNSNTLEGVIELYELVLPFASAPRPLCFLQLDLVNLYYAADKPSRALRYLDEAAGNCPEQIDSGAFVERRDHRELREEFTNVLASGDKAKAKELALVLIQYDPKHSEALALLTFDDLSQHVDNGQATLNLNGAPEPIELRQFSMPHNGDWGDVIFMHPPASASFTIELPDEPVALRSRVALDPVSWEWGGDGVTFVITIEDELGTAVEIFRDHVPNDELGHDWHDVFVPLTKYVGQTVTITLRTEVGPDGDGTGDWAGWETPRLIWNLPDIDSE